MSLTQFSPSSSPSSLTFLMHTAQFGGIEKVVINLVQDISQGKPGRIDLVLARAEGEFLAEIPNNVRIFDLNTFHVDRLRGSISLLRPLVKYFKTEKPDWVVSNLRSYNVIAVLAKILARSSAKLILVEHISIKETFDRTWLLPWLMRLLYPFSDRVITVSRHMKFQLEKAIGLSSSHVEVIYNPVISSNLIEHAKASVNHPWFTPTQPPVILAVGRLESHKDFAMLIKAFAKLRQNQEARLVILGAGNQYRQLSQLIQKLGIEKDAALLGFTQNPYAYMSKASLFALSSRSEGLPTVLIEAMALRLPIVATNCETGPEEILDGGRYGWLVDVGDVNAMAQAMSNVLEGEQKPIDQSWLQQFTVKTAAEKYWTLLETLT